MNAVILELAPLLKEQGLHLPLEEHFQHFLALESFPSSLTFLRYLQNQQFISETVYINLLGQLSVELTGLDLLNPYYDQTAIVDQRIALDADLDQHLRKDEIAKFRSPGGNSH